MLTVQHFYTGPISVNTYLGYDESKAAFIVDPGAYCADLSGIVRAQGLDVRYILLTHGHGDHIGGVEAFRRCYPEAKVAAGIHEKELMADPGLNSSTEINGRPIRVEADIWLREGDVIHCGLTELGVLYTPGHTRGGICFVTDGACFAGDTLFRMSIGRTDFPGGDYGEIIDSIKNKLFSLPDDTVVYTGHMEATTIGFEKRHNPFVQDKDR